MIIKSEKTAKQPNQPSWYNSIRLSQLPKKASGLFASFKKTTINIVTNLGILNQGSLSLYGVLLLIFTATDGIRLHNLWTNQGRYSDKDVSSFKRKKTSFYLAISRLLAITMLGIRLFTAAGIMAVCAAVPVILMAARLLEKIIRYNHSLIRAFIRNDALIPNSPDYCEQKKAIEYKINNGLVKLGLAALGTVILTTSIVLTGPAAPLITIGLWVAWGIADAVYNMAIKPKLKAKMNPDSIQPTNYIELKTIHSSQFDNSPVKVLNNTTKDYYLTRSDQAVQRTTQSLQTPIRSARCSS